VVDHLQPEDRAVLSPRHRQQYPYRVYGTQQDNTSISVPSASEWGVITLADCTYPGTGRAASSPSSQGAQRRYIGAIGSSPGGSGALQRYDIDTPDPAVNVWPEESTGIAPGTCGTLRLTYRSCSRRTIPTTPLCRRQLRLSARATRALDWEKISPDLSLNDRRARALPGRYHPSRVPARGPPRLCLRCRIAHRSGEIWASTDDGLVHVTARRRQGVEDVTPKRYRTRLCRLCRSLPHDADTIYLAATRYKLATTSPTCSGAATAARAGNRSRATAGGRDTARRARRSVAKGPTLHRHRAGCSSSLDDGAHWTAHGRRFPSCRCTTSS